MQVTDTLPVLGHTHWTHVMWWQRENVSPTENQTQAQLYNH